MYKYICRYTDLTINILVDAMSEWKLEWQNSDSDNYNLIESLGIPVPGQ